MKDNNDTIIDKNSDKYKIVLKLANNILANLEKNKIADLTDFKSIERDDIIKDINKKSLSNMEKEIHKYFDKDEISWYRRNYVDHYILTFLRAVCPNIGLKFKFEKKDITTEINGKRFRRTHVYYSIVEK